MVTRRRTTWVFALLAVLFGACVPAANAAWQCQGRQCGDTPWACCCQSAAEEPECDCGGCAEETVRAGRAQTGCECEIVVGAPRDARPATRASLATATGCVALHPHAPFCLTAVPQIAVVSPEPAASPPPQSPLGGPSLRAPPA